MLFKPNSYLACFVNHASKGSGDSLVDASVSAKPTIEWGSAPLFPPKASVDRLGQGVAAWIVVDGYSREWMTKSTTPFLTREAQL